VTNPVIEHVWPIIIQPLTMSDPKSVNPHALRALLSITNQVEFLLLCCRADFSVLHCKAICRSPETQTLPNALLQKWRLTRFSPLIIQFLSFKLLYLVF
jgi:hypothetical protein